MVCFLALYINYEPFIEVGTTIETNEEGEWTCDFLKHKKFGDLHPFLIKLDNSYNFLMRVFAKTEAWYWKFYEKKYLKTEAKYNHAFSQVFHARGYCKEALISCKPELFLESLYNMVVTIQQFTEISNKNDKRKKNRKSK